MSTAESRGAMRAIAGALQELIDGVRPKGWNYLIASSGNAYLQFSRDYSDQSVLAEAVSNAFLPQGHELDSRAIEALHTMGFEDPDLEVAAAQCRTAQTAAEVGRGSPNESPNFFRYFDVATPAKVAALASLAVQALVVVYGEDPEVSLKLELNLGVGRIGESDEGSSEGGSPVVLPVAEPRLANWSIRCGPGDEPVIYDSATGDEIATVHGGDQALGRALLLQRAPTLLEAVSAAAQVFAAMSKNGSERERATGADMVPIMQAALYLLDDRAGET